MFHHLRSIILVNAFGLSNIGVQLYTDMVEFRFTNVEVQFYFCNPKFQLLSVILH